MGTSIILYKKVYTNWKYPTVDVGAPEEQTGWYLNLKRPKIVTKNWTFSPQGEFLGSGNNETE
jgi:hypothetical protein